MRGSQKIDGSLTITYPSNNRGDGEPHVRVAIRDKASGIEFVDFEISHHEFSRALSSLAGRPSLECEVRGLEFVGKTREQEQVKVYPGVEIASGYSKPELADAQLQEVAKDQRLTDCGWMISTYHALNARDGHGRDKDGREWYLLTRVRYV